ncbi:MAG: adenylate kinase family protein [Candidatus Bathyarchaeota archaeon]|nr:adenylate kinase family protein [Candidatus Bathyarchaeota archaeon]
MSRRVILITGTPCVGKTTLARQLCKKLNAAYINLTELAEKEHLIQGEDEKRKTKIINEKKMRRKIRVSLDKAEDGDIIIDGHYAATVVPKNYVTRVFVLRRNPVELRRFMEKNGFQGPKLWENLASEILDVCLVEALSKHEREKVCELDVTGKTVKDSANEVVAIINSRKKCHTGCVDWLGMLEKEGLTSEYLKI